MQIKQLPQNVGKFAGYRNTFSVIRLASHHTHSQKQRNGSFHGCVTSNFIVLLILLGILSGNKTLLCFRFVCPCERLRSNLLRASLNVIKLLFSDKELVGKFDRTKRFTAFNSCLFYKNATCLSCALKVVQSFC